MSDGWTRSNGKRPPGKHWGDKVFVQLRNGMCPPEPWPIASTKSGQTRWVWGDEPDGYDIIGIRKA